MPAKRIVILDSVPGQSAYRAVLWADVPVGNQMAYLNPLAKSAYGNATPAEVQAIRDGLVAEKLVTWSPPSGALTWAAAAPAFQTMWADWQAQVTAEANWIDYGRSWDGVTWAVTPGVPTCALQEQIEGLPAFVALTPVSAFAANKFHFALYNGAAPATSQSLVVKVRLVVIQPQAAVVTGIASGPWTLARRSAPTTPPGGTGSFAAALLDTACALPAGITLYNAPGTAPAGGTTTTINQFFPQPDELKVTTADAPTLAALFSAWGGQVVYRSDDIKAARPLAVRPGQCLEVQQDATAGTGNCRVLCVFTVG